MAGHTYDDLQRALKKGQLAPAYYLHGPEEILKDEGARLILDQALDPVSRDFNFDQRSASQLEPETLHALLNTLPMMAERRVVLVRDVEAWRKKAAPRSTLLKYLANPAAETVVILIQGAGDPKEKQPDADAEIAELSYAVKFKELEPERAVKWLHWRGEQLGLTFAPGAEEHLARAVEYDLGAIRSELQKLSGLPDAELLSVERVGQLVGIRHGETLDDWRNAVLADQTGKALHLIDKVLAQSSMTGVKMVSALGTALVLLGVARTHYDRGLRGERLEREIFQSLMRTRPFGIGGWKEVSTRWAGLPARWPLARIDEAIPSALAADMALKGTRISDEGGVLTDLVLQLALSGSAAGRPGDAGPPGRASQKNSATVGA